MLALRISIMTKTETYPLSNLRYSRTILMVFSTLSLFFVKDLSQNTKETGTGKWRQLADGWIYLWKDSDLRIISMMKFVSNIGEAVWTGCILFGICERNFA
ncbi:hypothetical protein [Thermoactinomyces mirandus]|uniref:hypothetical protein n=1 Tax=Thermoactinomyces mirandus TaxID=2756294 RepID=UPI0015EF35C9|nr:hypothetical protein [Thermoactinomyces mirandus]